MRCVVRLTRSVWEFLVGDAPEFALVVSIVVVVANVAHRVRLLVVIGLPIFVGMSVLASAALFARRHRSRRELNEAE